jgi:hypothetical protein
VIAKYTYGAMSDNKTKPTKGSPEAFIKRVASSQQQKDCHELIAMMRKITGEPPKMWGPSIVGFGACHYVYESGREGDMCLTGFSPRKPRLVLYIGEALQDETLMSKLGNYTTGKSCLYLKTLDDVDRDVLRALVTKAVRDARKRYSA